MTIYDVDHYTKEQADQIIASYPSHEREARAKGVPTMGAGRIYPISDDELLIDPRPIPKHWPQIIGIDFGWDHPFAAVNLAYDRDYDRVYVTNTYRQREQTPIIHAAALRPWGEWIPVAWPNDGYQHSKGDGQQLKAQYQAQHLNMLPIHATHAEDDKSTGVEAGIAIILERMQTDRFKVFRGLDEWMEEFRLYHRVQMDNGGVKINKMRDDLMDATRYAVMMLRHSAVQSFGGRRKPKRLATL